ncbi:Arsenic efflux pump protein [Candidatus Methanomethylophilus alvi Mx1201]|uniref:Arsenic efflux pump protein n=1 Tax=Methanomethylophilus alvi (strain Mx1201) TaxID=1236689 RepID=M9SCY6_METAX|nr:SLC13 family permease [Methanomethylophilus alvi]AGI85619.1 Arsenic efflux pump protein [Candidatus Methanomethylophilus alvi Mx1201]MCI5973525.1 arsenic ABC transporter [Methanomethylophilus alvi]MDD7479644.1 SLC13 family permease [Methanomethylophilus alvi]MDY7060861.1 SLC13 family permease [Methanomethylophilus alvi]
MFVLTYSLIAVRKVNGRRIRTWTAAVLGGVLMLLLGVVTPSEAWDYINFEVILQLAGMMMLTASLQYCGFFEIVVDFLMRRFDGRRRFLSGVMAITACLSAVMLNDAVVLIFTPIVLRCCQRMRADPVPYMVGVFVSANIGSAATVVGNPQNALVASMAGIGFLDYSIRVIPLTVICMAVAMLMMRRMYGGRLDTDDASLSGETFHTREVDKYRLCAVLAVTVTALVLFALSVPLGLRIYQIALAAGAVSLIIVLTDSMRAGGYVIRHVDWSILLFFTGLFVVIAGAVSSGLLDSMSELFGMGDGNVPSIGVLSGFSTVLANLVSNVPSVMLIGQLLPEGDMVLWITLAVTSTFAGNLTLIGAAANIIVEDEGEKHGIRMDFFRYLRVGIPIAVITIVIATAYLYMLDILL